MTRKLVPIIIFLFFWSPQIVADDAADVRATIERHYAAIHAQNTEVVVSHHLADFTMFLADGGILWDSDWAEASERMGATTEFPVLNVRMSSFDAQIYGNVAVATFFLVGTATRGDKTRDIINRVSAVWVKSSGEWKEAHHHESPLLSHKNKH
jgi:ketosteroid isomerase-like protein